MIKVMKSGPTETHFLSYFPTLRKKVGLRDHHSVCVCVYVCFPPISASEPI